MPFSKGQSGNPNGKKKGVENKLTTQVKKSLAQLFDGELEKVADEVKKLHGVQYLDYMLALLPYIAKKMPAENNLVVSNGNLDTTELRNISLEGRQKIKEIFLLEQGN